LLREVFDSGPRDLALVSRKPTFQLEACQQHGKAHLVSGRLLGSGERSSTDNDQGSRSSWVLQYRFMRAPRMRHHVGKAPRVYQEYPGGELTHGTWLQRPCHWASIENNKGYIPNDGERYRNVERISTGVVESTVNQVVSKRFCKKPQMPWTKRAVHLLLHTRVQTLNHELSASRYN
jgi:hypothetical protein